MVDSQNIPQDLLKRLGIKIGHYTDEKNITGLTAFIAEQSADIGIDICGSNTGTFNTPAFEPKAAGKTAHAVVKAINTSLPNAENITNFSSFR